MYRTSKFAEHGSFRWSNAYGRKRCMRTGKKKKLNGSVSSQVIARALPCADLDVLEHIIILVSWHFRRGYGHPAETPRVFQSMTL